MTVESHDPDTPSARTERERQLQSALVAEVHHRVKNLLQGVVGLLRATKVESDEARRVLDTVVSQVMTLSIGFGLAGAHNGVVHVVELVVEVARYLEPLLGVRIEVRVEPSVAGAAPALDESDGVNLGLVVNELLVNAWKHRAATVPAVLRVDLAAAGSGVRLEVLTPGASLPAGFDFAAGRGLGTGLTLVRALLPAPGAALDLSASAEGVRTRLTLGPSLLRRAT